MPGPLEQQYRSALENNRLDDALVILKNNPSQVASLVNLKNSRNSTFLHIGISSRNVAVVDFLSQQPSLDLTVKNSVGQIAFRHAEISLQNAMESRRSTPSRIAACQDMVSMLKNPAFLAFCQARDGSSAKKMLQDYDLEPNVIQTGIQKVQRSGALMLALELTQLAKNKTTVGKESVLKEVETKRVGLYQDRIKSFTNGGTNTSNANLASKFGKFSINQHGAATINHSNQQHQPTAYLKA